MADCRLLFLEFNFRKEKYFQACRPFQAYAGRAARQSFGPRSFAAGNFAELRRRPHDARSQARWGSLGIVELWR